MSSSSASIPKRARSGLNVICAYPAVKSRSVAEQLDDEVLCDATHDDHAQIKHLLELFLQKYEVRVQYAFA